jgi:hypothetical protein
MRINPAGRNLALVRHWGRLPAVARPPTVAEAGTRPAGGRVRRAGPSFAKASAMSWSRPLPKLIVLRDGRELKTLADARALILTLPVRHQAKQH